MSNIPSFDDGVTDWDQPNTYWSDFSGVGASSQSSSSVDGVGLNSNITLRLQKWLPTGWFPVGTGTRIFATLAGFAANLSGVLGQISYVKLQTRIRSATDGFLDLISFDFFGNVLPRNNAETDASFRARILSSLFQPRATRLGMITTLTTLTGRTPRVFEPKRPMDTGGWGGNPFGGYGVAGGYSNPAIQPFQALVTVYRGNDVPDAVIYSTVDATKPIATIMWVGISN